ncbi:dTDP-4-dehydrorhamnose 3,5-epimerase family protein [Candidatus Gottesmanbacteria bacterium]|nr:dTDP-4-dehydrorhamnose 3,5-epimerase family protein [Candidatus Gottesmanbacteria bacterium]
MIDGVRTKDMVRHPDERGFFVELIRVSDPIFAEGFGQLSRSSMITGVVKAWHVHKTQVDWWYVVKGRVKVALYDTRAGGVTYKELNEFILGEEGQDIILKIPAGVAHGLKVIKGPAELVYVTSGIYSKEEEGRIPYDDADIGYDWVQGMEITNKNIT